ncbi:MAG: chemotaxis protein CheD [Georgfuchsia sp.]
MATQAALTGKDFERLALNINPGGWSVETVRPISTLLGSCVAVCVFDPAIKLGGMNHFLLPSKRAGANDDDDVVLAGDFAMELLVNAMLARGARKERLLAKAFGGGNIVSAIRMAIGDRNAEFATEWLEREGIPLTASDFGGPWSRKVICVPNTGEAFCRRAPVNQSVAEVVKAEAAYERGLSVAKAKKIELF